MARRSHILSDGIVLGLATTIALPVFANAFGFQGPLTVFFAIIWLSGAADRLVSFRSGRYQPYQLSWNGMRSTGFSFFLVSVALTLLVVCREWFPQWPSWTTVTMPFGVRLLGAAVGVGLTLLRLHFRRVESNDCRSARFPLSYSTAEPMFLSISLLLMTGSIIAVVALPWWLLRDFRAAALAQQVEPFGLRAELEAGIQIG